MVSCLARAWPFNANAYIQISVYYLNQFSEFLVVQGQASYTNFHNASFPTCRVKMIIPVPWESIK